MNAEPTRQASIRRYRRRILGWGAAGVVALFAIGAVVTGTQVENDLNDRVRDEFLAAGVTPVVISFDGQDGTVFCREGPVDVPDSVLIESRSLWGVRKLDVDASCSRSLPVEPNDPVTTAPATTAVPIATAATQPPSTEPLNIDTDTVVDVISSDAELSIFRGLLDEADLISTLAGDGPFTVFAPTNKAFEAVGNDTIDRLRNDGELEAVLLHHATAGAQLAADFSSGSLTMLDGSDISLDVGAAGSSGVGADLTSAQSTSSVEQADLTAANGVVHVVDHVLVPAGVLAPPIANVTADYDGAQIVLSGEVATSTQEEQLVAAAAAEVGADNVVNELSVVDDTALTDEQAGGLVVLIESMEPNLVVGTAAVDVDGLSYSGIYASAEALAALEAAATSAGISDSARISLTERADATDAEATGLEDELNALVLAEPILFEQNSAVISDESADTLDRLASLVNRFGGVTIEIQGHTDTDGQASTNEQLSEGRASAVLTALTDRGIAADTLTSSGFGGSNPIVDANGEEDKAASRRVEFVVIAVST